MNTFVTTRSLHPVQWAAAIAVILFSVVGIGAITGVIPIAKSAPEPQTAAPAAVVPPTPVAMAPAPVVVAPQPEVVVKHTSPVKHHRVEVARNDPIPPVPADYTPPVAPPICHDCGKIESVQRVMHDGEGSGVGAVAGGALGGLLGNGIGHGNGRAAATIAGVVGGALLGNHVEKSQKQVASYQTVVRFDDGSSRVFTSATEPTWRIGSRVHMSDGEIQLD
jgi:outer membrane lipoprotein SlyB